MYLYYIWYQLQICVWHIDIETPLYLIILAQDKTSIVTTDFYSIDEQDNNCCHQPQTLFLKCIEEVHKRVEVNFKKQWMCWKLINMSHNKSSTKRMLLQKGNISNLFCEIQNLYHYTRYTIKLVNLYSLNIE